MSITKREALPIVAVLGITLALALSLALVARTEAAVSCTFTQNLYPGVRSEQVRCLQQYLNSAGYAVASSGAGSKGNETTYFGSLTRTAVKKWQDAVGLSYGAFWGYFGPASRAKYSSVVGGGVVPAPVGGGLSVGLSGMTPASRAIVIGAANMPFTRFTFTAGSGAVTVTSLKFTKSGISADAELGSAYLYDADSGAYLSQYIGLGSGVLTFSNSGGLFTVNAGQTKNVELRLDVSTSASNNHTMAWGLNAASDVVSNASSVSGNFPATGNAMSFVLVTNPAVATLTTLAVTTGNSVNAGTSGYLAGSFTLQAGNSAVLLDRIVLTQNGTLISGSDVANIKLVTTGGQQLGAVLPALSANGEGVFAMSPAYEIPSGQTIQINIYADVIGGVNRSLKFNVLNLRDVQARDKTYNVGVSPSATVNMTSTSIGSGTLVVTLDPSTPTGNIAPGQTNVTLAKFKVVSYGEQVKVLFVPFKLTAGATTQWNGEVDNVYLVDDAGNQIGTTITTPTTFVGTAWLSTDSNVAATFGTSGAPINYLIPANTTRIWSLKLDVLTTASSTITAALDTPSAANYQGQVSYNTGTTVLVSASTLTVTSNPFTGQANSAVGAGNITAGQSSAKIGSWVLSASSAEGINVSTVTITSSSTFPFANLIAKVNGVQFGDIKGSVAVSTSYTFSGASPALIPAGGSITVDLYADVLSTATGLGSSYYAVLSSASAVGASTATSQTLKTTAGVAVTSALPINGQSYTVQTTGGTLTIDNDASSPAAYQVVMGKTGQTLGIWRFTADANSDKNITDVTMTDVLGTASQKAMFKNLQFYKGGVATGPIIVSGTASGTAGFTYTFHFTSPVVVPQNGGISLEMRGDVATFAEAGETGTSNSVHTFRVESTDDVTALSSGGSLAVLISGPNGSTGTDVSAITVARTKLTVTSDATGIVTTGHISSAADDMAVFVFNADPAADVTIKTVTLKLAGSTLSTIVVKLIDSDTNTTWGSSASAGVTYGQGPASSSIAFSPNYPLTAGATKRVKVRADTTGSTSAADAAFTPTAGNTSGTQAQWYIDNDTSGSSGSVVQNALCWQDGTSLCSAGAFNLETKVLPVYGPALRY